MIENWIVLVELEKDPRGFLLVYISNVLIYTYVINVDLQSVNFYDSFESLGEGEGER